MTSVTAKTKKGNTVYILEFNPETDRIDHDEGLCIACGQFNYGVEPDMRKGKCESCNQPRVYGLEELILMGYYRLPKA